MTRHKYKVTDTNIFLLDAKEALYSFKPKKPDTINTLMIPFVVLEEINKYKTEQFTTRGYNARVFGNELKKVIQEKKRSINQPLQLGENYFVQIMTEYNTSTVENLSVKVDLSSNDNLILAMALDLAKQEGKENVELVTNDVNLFLKGSALDLIVNDWKAARSIDDYADIYKGWRELAVDESVVNTLLPGKTVLDINQLDIDITNVMPNEYFALKASEDYEIPSFKDGAPNSNQFVLARYVQNVKGFDNGALIKIPFRAGNSSGILGIKSRNFEQSFALDALLNDNIDMVNLIGPAGTGKTLLSIASGLYQLKTNNDSKGNNHYNSVTISRPIVPMGNQLGFLPGKIIDKMGPWLDAIFDNIKPEMRDQVINKLTKSSSLKAELKKMNATELKEHLMNADYMEIQSLEHIRGRSMDEKFIMIDESQNIDPLETKTIVTRAGNGTKIVMTGDPQQIDKPGLNELTNGLCYSSERMNDSALTATVFMSKGERSELATLAAERL
jgi:PhoH-like ATPase